VGLEFDAFKQDTASGFAFVDCGHTNPAGCNALHDVAFDVTDGLLAII
jgi:hypothetical protein